MKLANSIFVRLEFGLKSDFIIGIQAGYQINWITVSLAISKFIKYALFTGGQEVASSNLAAPTVSKVFKHKELGEWRKIF